MTHPIVRRAAVEAALLVGFVAISVAVRGQAVGQLSVLNPDEAELLFQARAALESPVPFSTWTAGTTGPYWPLVLALLGALGAPLTLAFAHLLAAVLVGVMGFALSVLLRRTLPLGAALVIAVAWWLPLALVFPVGGSTDFAALSTEYLPATLVLLAALIPRDAIRARPPLAILPGVLLGVAVLAKYQVAPLALVFLVVQLIELRGPVSRLLLHVLWIGVGSASALIAIVIPVLVSPTVSDALLSQTFTFLGSYAGGVGDSRITATLAVLWACRWYLIAALALVGWLAIRSSPRENVVRVLWIVGGVVAVAIGGKGFGHYLILLFAALALAAAPALKPGARLLPGPRSARAVLATGVVAVVVVLVVGAAIGRWRPAAPAEVGAAFSSESVHRIATLEEPCPAGSEVTVWGWAPELYVSQSWSNAIPYPNVLGILSSPEFREQAEPVVSNGIAASECVIEALGPPYFGVGAESDIATVYPRLAEVLDDDFEIVDGLPDCEACLVHVRRD